MSECASCMRWLAALHLLLVSPGVAQKAKGCGTDVILKLTENPEKDEYKKCIVGQLLITPSVTRIGETAFQDGIIDNVTIAFAETELAVGVKAFEDVNDDRGGTLTVIRLCNPRGCAADSNTSTQSDCYRQLKEEEDRTFFGVDAAFDGVSVEYVNETCLFVPPAAPPPLPLAPPSLPPLPPLLPGKAGGGEPGGGEPGGGEPGGNEIPDGGSGSLRGVEATVGLGVGVVLSIIVLLVLGVLLHRRCPRARAEPSGKNEGVPVGISLQRLVAKVVAVAANAAAAAYEGSGSIRGTLRGRGSEDRVSLQSRHGGEVPVSPLELPSALREGAPEPSRDVHEDGEDMFKVSVVSSRAEPADTLNKWRARSRGESGPPPGATPSEAGAAPADGEEVEWWFYFGRGGLS